ncbi:D-alanyl-D-alanine carboxypeptidase [Streptomyces sp. NBC_01803]|uniref:D-alanyl-D-alanine carboxypeptidase n=1 Tax=Streptomyces sp. NBC_01803 TaxID=2975946 RepID=UPI002DD9917D|nr:D-alanyl-D-alanine carboxypeptidase [Streptomyces sp. NBC_01803]WSA44634.1 D-alanyl-D-alanine carboxypeptidase [Streptomyces sp. NBC_01803]
MRIPDQTDRSSAGEPPAPGDDVPAGDDATSVLRLPDAPDRAGDRGTTSLRVPAEEPEGEPEDVEDAEDDVPAGDDATSVLRLPEAPDRAGDRGTTSLRVPAEDGVGEPEDVEDAEDDVPAGDDATSVLRLPEAPDRAGDRGTTSLRVPAEEPEDDVPAGDRGTTSLRVPAEDGVGEPEDAEDAEDDVPAGDRGTTSLRVPAEEPEDEPEDKKPVGGGGDSAGLIPSPVGAKAKDVEQPTGVLPLPPAVEPPAAPPKPVAAPPVPDAQRDPLDLLAQLTNRPAPPPTPLRTFGRRVKIWTPLVVLLVVAFVIAQSLRPLPEPTLEMTATQTYTFDGESPTAPWPDSGQAVLDVEGLGTFGSSGEQEPVPIASVAKVMTAYVILENHPMAEDGDGESVPVDQLAEDEAALSDDGESTVEVEAGGSITQREALQAILIASANNVARLLARWDAGSEEDFVAEMNETAAELGMENTTYTDPSGLNEDTVSTAEDQVILAKAAMDDPVFRAIVAMPSYEDSNGDVHGNWNHLVPVNGVIGIKTGTTSAAGGNLLFAAEQEVGGTRQLIIGAVLDQPPHPSDNSILTGALTASDALIRFGQGELRDETVLSEGDVVGYVDDGLGGRTPVVATEDVQAVGWAGLEVEMELSTGEGGLPGSADAGTQVGVLTVGGGPDRVTVPVALAEDLGEPGFADRLTRVG